MRKVLWHRAFLVALEQSDGNVTLAASRVGRHPTQAYRARRANREFAAAWDETLHKLESNLCQHVDRRGARYA